MPSMGTYAIFRQLRQHWVSVSHPIYRAELGRTAAYWLNRRPASPTAEPSSRIKNLVLLAVVFIAVATIIPGLANSIPAFALSGLGIFLFGATWIGYIQMARRTSRLIVEEREKQTWDALLTTPYARTEILLAKIAAAMRTYYIDLLLWLQTIFLIGFFAVDVYQEVAHPPLFLNQNAGGLWEIILAYAPLLVIVLISYTVGRVQDFILISLIGTAVSVLAPNRHIAAVGGVFAGITYLLLNAFLIVLAIPLVEIGGLSYRGEFLAGLTATGPIGAILVGLSLPGAILSTGAIILLREILIRLLFGWLSRHLSER